MASVVVVEPWYGGSHRAWLDGWQSRSRHAISTVTLADRFWRWRMRAGSVAMASDFDAWVAANGRPDAVVVSSLVDVAAFCGLARRSLGPIPVAVYMHENQLLYPLAPNQRPDTDLSLANWRSLLAGDAVWWNSAYHRDALLAGLGELLDRQPDSVDPDQLERVANASTVLWPGVDAAALIGSPKPDNRVPLVLWNQRWDHDKNPAVVFKALARLARDGVEFEVALAGRNDAHGDLDGWIQQELGDRIVHQGWLEPAEYAAMLVAADVVVSAADHEFFGIAIVEAIAAGAIPVLPDRLSFPELIEPRYHRFALYGEGQLRKHLESVLLDPERARSQMEGIRASMERFDWAHSVRDHDSAVDRLIGA